MLNNKNTGLSYSLMETLVPSVILVAFIAITGIAVFNMAKMGGTTVNEFNEASVWEKAYIEAEKNKVGIQFNPIVTSDEIYNDLRLECNAFIEKEGNLAEADANILVDTIIDEEQYIDTKVEPKGVGKDTGVMAETGPIYFNDMLMIRYINNEGKLVVITGILNNGEMLVVRQDELVKTLRSIGYFSDNTLSDIDKASWISEEVYLEEIKVTLSKMLMASTESEIEEAERLAIKYFTLEGKNTVLGNEAVDAVHTSNIEIMTMLAGKSDSNKSYKDRIYTQLKVDIDGKQSVINIILKLNNNIRIYDIDII